MGCFSTIYRGFIDQIYTVYGSQAKVLAIKFRNHFMKIWLTRLF